MSQLALIFNNMIDHVLPITAVIGLGWVMGRMKLFNYEQARGINRFTLFAAMPALLVTLLGRADLAAVDVRLNLILLAIMIVGYVGVFCIAYFLMGRDAKQALLLGFSTSFANQFFLALPILTSAVGPNAVPVVVMTAILDTFVLYGFTVFAIGLLDGGSLLSAIKRFLRDPVVIFPALALAINLSGLVLPEPVFKFSTFLGGAASPLALFVLGIIMSVPRQGSVKLASIITLYKLAIAPVLLFVMIGFLNSDALSEDIILVMAVAPLGLTPFVLGLNEGVRVETIGMAILFTTFIATFMMPIFL